jgi:hypothetical protein
MNPFRIDLQISIIGEFGKYQAINVALMAFTGFIFSWLNFENKFLVSEVDFWCAKVCFIIYNDGSAVLKETSRHEMFIDHIWLYFWVRV